MHKQRVQLVVARDLNSLTGPVLATREQIDSNFGGDVD